MFGRCVNDDNWVTRIVQAVAITPGCWWRYAPAVCAVELCWRVVTRDETGNSFLISPSLSCWKLSWKPHHSRGRDQLPAPALVSYNVDISVPCFHNVWRMPLLSTMAIYAKRVFKLNMVSLCMLKNKHTNPMATYCLWTPVWHCRLIGSSIWKGK